MPSLLAVVLLCGAQAAQGAGSAASSPIEGVWSFNGGKVAIQSRGGPGFLGTIVDPTRFAQCSHPVGEVMWTEIAPRPDGSYWGFHQWYFESAACTPNPLRGSTAWRVLTAASGSRFLRVCFSSPGTSQPTIAPDGSSANVTYACVDSALAAALPVGAAPASRAGALGFARSVSLPSNRKCFSRRIFRIHLREPRYDPFKKVVVTLRRRRVTIVRHGKVFASTIDLRGLPRGRFTVTIRATTVLGHLLSGARRYHTCTKKRVKSKRPRSHSRGHI